MKRIFIIFLVLLLPVQFSFATASAYCEDEVVVSSEHYGHHDHAGAGPSVPDVPEVSDAADVPAKPDGESKPAGHAECGVCHLGCAKLLNATLTLATPESGLPAIHPLLLSVAQHQPVPLQRPPIDTLA